MWKCYVGIVFLIGGVVIFMVVFVVSVVIDVWMKNNFLFFIVLVFVVLFGMLDDCFDLSVKGCFMC